MTLHWLACTLLFVVGTAWGEKAAAPAGGMELPLRLWAQRREVQLGTAIDAAPLRDEARYRALAGREFSMLTPADAMKMGPLRPERAGFSWAESDALVEFAEAHAQRVHGHTLVWHGQLPAWLEAGPWTREELAPVLREHIAAVVGRYRGRVQLWDVVNEAFEDDGRRRESPWQRVLGGDYLEHAFRWAHEADPAAVLIYNDYNGEGLGKKSDAIYELLRELKGRGVPVHGVALQMHMTVGQLPPASELRANLRRLAELGLELHITEADVRMPLPATPEVWRSRRRTIRSWCRLPWSFRNCARGRSGLQRPALVDPAHLQGPRDGAALGRKLSAEAGPRGVGPGAAGAVKPGGGAAFARS